MTYTADFPLPHRWWIAPAEGRPPRDSSRYERARVASLAVQNAIRDARIRADLAATEGETASAPHAVDHPGRDAARHRRSGPPPSKPIIRPRRPRNTSKAARPIRRRGCVPRRTWNGSPPTPTPPTSAAAPWRTGRSPSSRLTRSSPRTTSSTHSLDPLLRRQQAKLI